MLCSGPLSPLGVPTPPSDLLTTTTLDPVEFLASLPSEFGDTGTVSPSHASSSRDGVRESNGGRGAECRDAKWGAFANNEGGIGISAG